MALVGTKAGGQAGRKHSGSISHPCPAFLAPCARTQVMLVTQPPSVLSFSCQQAGGQVLLAALAMMAGYPSLNDKLFLPVYHWAV